MKSVRVLARIVATPRKLWRGSLFAALLVSVGCGSRAGDPESAQLACDVSRAAPWAVAVGDGHQPRARLATTPAGAYVVASGRVSEPVCGTTSGNASAPGYLALYNAAGRASWMRRFWPVTEQVALVAVGSDALLLTDVSAGDDLGGGALEKGLVLGRFGPTGDPQWIQRVGAVDEVKTAKLAASPSGDLSAVYGACPGAATRPGCTGFGESYVDLRGRDGARLGLVSIGSKDSPAPIELDAVAVGADASLAVIGRAPTGAIRVNEAPYATDAPAGPAVFAAKIAADGRAVRVVFWTERVIPRAAAFVGDALIIGGDAGEATALAGKPLTGAWLAGGRELVPEWVHSTAGAVTFGRLAADGVGALAALRASEAVTVHGTSIAAGSFFTMSVSSAGTLGALKQLPALEVGGIGLLGSGELAVVGTPHEVLQVGGTTVTQDVVALLRLPWGR